MIMKTKLAIGLRQFAYWKYIQRDGANKNQKIIGFVWLAKLGRISVTISDELEKELRFKTIERFGGKKGDLTRAVEEE